MLDCPDKINNYLKLAKRVLEQGDYDEGQMYASKVLELDSQVSEAWYIEAQVSCIKSVELYSQSLTLFENAFKYAAEDNKEILLANIEALLVKYGTSYIRSSSAILQQDFNTNSLNSFKNTYESILNSYDCYLESDSSDNPFYNMVYKVKEEILEKLEEVTDSLIAAVLSWYKTKRYKSSSKENKFIAVGLICEIQLAYNYCIDYYKDDIDKVIELANKQFNSICKIRPFFDTEVRTLRDKYLEKPTKLLREYYAKKKALDKQVASK